MTCVKGLLGRSYINIKVQWYYIHVTFGNFKVLRIHLSNFYFQNFPGRPCPQTPPGCSLYKKKLAKIFLTCLQEWIGKMWQSCQIYTLNFIKICPPPKSPRNFLTKYPKKVVMLCYFNNPGESGGLTPQLGYIRLGRVAINTDIFLPARTYMFQSVPIKKINK